MLAERAGKMESPLSVDHVVLLEKPDPSFRNVDQPPVMGKPRLSGAFDPQTRLEGSRRHLDVAGLRHPDELGTDPQGVAKVFQGVRADYEVELLVGKRPRALLADVALHPGLPAEPFLRSPLEGLAAESAIEATRLEGLSVQDPLRPVEGACPAA